MLYTLKDTSNNANWLYMIQDNCVYYFSVSGLIWVESFLEVPNITNSKDYLRIL